MGGEGGGGENPCLRVESEELRVEMWCVRFRGHFFIVRGRGGASPARGFAVMTILRIIRRGGIHAARRSHPDKAM